MATDVVAIHYYMCVSGKALDTQPLFTPATASEKER